MVVYTLYLAVMHYRLERMTRVFTHMSLEESKQELQQEEQRNVELLLSVLPKPLLEEMQNSKSGDSVFAEQVSAVTTLMADVVAFTPMCCRLQPSELVTLLGKLFTLFDTLTAAHSRATQNYRRRTEQLPRSPRKSDQLAVDGGGAHSPPFFPATI
eukprot:TRINITY_DN1152_c0_g1_i11.p3 TRINITY_DN1152_c0_g1~~TRINITY_DN1152_c0_g1_i11.p3  ORF type:complete len:156 (-),score=35.07 TRINITY_DN1152_c0_g1_i11:590-1057(-)